MTHIGPYRLLSPLGTGGMGVVHLALGPGDRAVAVKVLRPEIARDETSRARFAREVSALRGVRGRHVAEVLDADVASDPPYIVTRFVPGTRLDEAVGRDGAIQGARLLRLASGLADALRDIHAAGVVHRDLKPGNVLLVDGEPTVIDFGIARRLDDPTLTVVGLFVGTPGYLAPEALDGRRVTAAADVFAWGATVAFAATGRAPFGGGGLEEILARVTEGEPDLAGVPATLEPLVRSALSRRSEERPTAARLCAALAALDSLLTVAGAGEVGLPVTMAYPAAAPWPPPAAAAVVPGAPPTRALPAPRATLVLPARSAPAVPVPPMPVPPMPVPPVPVPPMPAPPMPGRRDRGRLAVVSLLALAVAGLAGALAPGVVAVVLLVVLVGLHTLDGSIQAHLLRRARRGRSGWDPALVVARLPGQVVRGALVTAAQVLLTGPLALAVAGATLLLGVAAERATVLAAAAGTGAASLILLSFGLPGGAGPRRAAAWLARPLVRGPGRVTVVMLMLGAVALALAGSVAASAEPSWWPLGSADLLPWAGHALP